MHDIRRGLGDLLNGPALDLPEWVVPTDGEMVIAFDAMKIVQPAHQTPWA